MESQRADRIERWNDRMQTPVDRDVALRAATAPEKLSDARVDPLREVDEHHGHTRAQCQLVELLRANPQSWTDRDGLSSASEYRPPPCEWEGLDRGRGDSE